MKGTQVTLHAVETNGPYLLGESLVEWDEATKKQIQVSTFAHYENRQLPQDEAFKAFDGKIEKPLGDGYVFEAYPDMRHFMRTGEIVVKVDRVR